MNRLTFIEDLGLKTVDIKGRKIRYGLFLCECGNKKTISISAVKTNHTMSCGCLKKERISNAVKTHGMSKSQLYGVWSGMLQRCYYEHNNQFNNYGGRGIKVCEEWKNDFVIFYDWCIKNNWYKGLQLDRVDNNCDYNPENCRIVTHSENCAVGRRRIKSTNKSGYTGVFYQNKDKVFVASMSGKYISCHKELNKAVEARIAKEIEVFGEQRTNFNYKGDNI
jgi:hypothetical protein